MRLRPRSLLIASLVPIGTMAAAEPATKEVEVNGITMPYVEEGEGEPVVFVHGAIADPRIWEPVREALSDDLHYIAPTLRHFGPGGQPDGELTPADFADAVFIEDLAAFIEALDLGPVNVVGWSSGAVLTTGLLFEHPDLVQSAVLFEPGFDVVLPEGEAGDPAREAAGQMFGAVGPAVEEGDAEKAARLLVEGVLQMEPGGFDSLPADRQQIFMDNAWTMPFFWTAPVIEVTCDKLGQVDKPVLVAHGGDSNAFWTQVAEGTAACLPEAEVAAVPGTNHGAPTQDPAAFARMVEEFVARH